MTNKLLSSLLYSQLLLGCFFLVITVSQASTEISSVFKLNNHQPTAQAGWDQAVDESALATSLDGSHSSDSDRDELTFFWAELEDTADGCSVVDFTSAQPQLTLVNRTDDYQCMFQLTVDDGQSEALPDTVTVYVTADNDPPVMPSLADIQALSGEHIYFSFQAHDPEQGALQLAVAQTDDEIDWNDFFTLSANGQGVFQWQPTHTQVGQYALTFTADDGASIVTDSISMLVLPANQEPVFGGALSDITLTVGSTATAVFDLADYFSDAADDALTYGLAATTTTTVLLDNSSVTFTAGGQPLTETIRFTATDSVGHRAKSNAVTITVLAQTATSSISYVQGKKNGPGVVTAFNNQYTSLASWTAFEHGGVTPYLVQHLGNDYVMAIRRVRGRLLKLFSTTGEYYDQIQLSPSLDWQVVGQVEADDDDQTVELLLAGQKQHKLFLQVLQFSAAQPLWKTWLTTTLANIPEKNSISAFNQSARILKPDGTVIATWRFGL